MVDSHSDSEAEEKEDTCPMLKWKSLGIEMSYPGSDSGAYSGQDGFKVLHGVYNLRSDWNTLFQLRLDAKKYKFNPNHDVIVRKIAEVLTAEGNHYIY